MKNLKICLLVFTAFIGFKAQAEIGESSFVLNFEEKSAKLAKILIQSESAEAASQAILTDVSSSRISAFQLQAMGRVLSGIHEDFSFLKFEFKKIEDGIGEYKKWKELKNPEKQLEAAQKFIQLLAEESWVGQDGKFAKLKNAFSKAIAKHKILEQQVAKYWIGEFKKIKDNKYDLSLLEGNNGLHEFKRNLRWITIEMAVFPNVVGLSSDTDHCPLSGSYLNYAIEALNFKYSKLVSASEARSFMQISPCLVSTIAHLVNDIDELKTDSEIFLKDHSDNKVPKDIKEKALEVYKIFKKSKVLDFLADEIEDFN